MRADDDVHLAGGEIGEGLLLFRLGAEPADHVDLDREAGEALLQRLLVLEGQHGRRREERDLLGIHHRLERRAHGDLGLAVADVAAQQAVHRRGRLHVALDVRDGCLLVWRQVVLERVLELLLPVRVGAEGVSRHGLARRVELEQLLRHVAHGLLDARLDALPGRPAEAIDRRPACAGVLLDQIEAFDRDEQLVLARVPQLEELLLVVADADLLQADEHADAVIHVNDEVADLQIAQIREERLGRRSPSFGRPAVFFEDVGLGEQLQARLRQPESPRQAPERDQHGRVPRIVGAIGLNGEDVVLLQQLDRPLGAARRRRHEHRRLAGLAQPPDLRHEIAHPAVQFDRRLAGDVVGGEGLQRLTALRRRLGIIVESELGDGGALIELGGYLRPVREQRVGRRRLFAPAHSLVVPALELLEEFRDIGVHLVAFGHDDARVASLGYVVEERRRAIVAQHVAKRHQGELIDRGNRALRAGVVRPECLDGVADELEADRVSGGSGEDIEDSAAAREFAVLVRGIFASEAGVDQELGEILRRDVLSRLQVHRRAEHALRRAHARQQGRAGRDDDAGDAAGEGVEGRGPHRRHADVRRHAAIRIHLVRRHGQHGAFDRGFRQAFERGQEEPHVGHCRVELRVARHDIQDDAVGHGAGGRRHEQGLGGRAQAGYGARGHVEAAARDGGLEDGPEVEGCGGRHRFTALRDQRGGFATLSMMLVVEYPVSNRTRTTRPPLASTISRPIMLASDQSAPFTSTSGCSFRMSS